ncbi:ABC transporter permease, partial [Escherichia coli]|uniref:ABC transporter permease n=1 Tax=Escherichia coli TaxID=562 RepID=UPI001AA15FF0
EHCPSVEYKTFVSDRDNLPARSGEESFESVQLTGVEASWFKIENRSIIMGRPFSLLDESQGRKVCIISTKLRDKLNMDRECTGSTILIGHNT